MAKFYELEFLGLKRKLPILPTPSGILIAGFNPVGDTTLIEKSGQVLKDKLLKDDVKFDIVLTTELKGIVIAQEISRLFGTDYVCLRKSEKCYMLDPVKSTGESITSGKTDYFVSSLDMDKLRGKRILFADDVFSTGATLSNIVGFANENQLKIVAGAFILKEAPKGLTTAPLDFEFNGINIYCCGFLPLQ